MRVLFVIERELGSSREAKNFASFIGDNITTVTAIQVYVPDNTPGDAAKEISTCASIGRRVIEIVNTPGESAWH